MRKLLKPTTIAQINLAEQQINVAGRDTPAP